jgi:hypothetical protein
MLTVKYRRVQLHSAADVKAWVEGLKPHQTNKTYALTWTLLALVTIAAEIYFNQGYGWCANEKDPEPREQSGPLNSCHFADTTILPYFANRWNRRPRLKT